MSDIEKQKTKRPQDITSLEREKRVNEVHALILQGATSSQIIEYCRQNFQVERASSYFYIAEAKEIIIENFEKTFDKDGFKAEIYARLENLYQQNMDIDDFKECRNILKDLREMLGLNSASKLDLTTNGQSINQLTPEQAKKKAEDLENDY
jgi:hypothetical protein